MARHQNSAANPRRPQLLAPPLRGGAGGGRRGRKPLRLRRRRPRRGGGSETPPHTAARPNAQPAGAGQAHAQPRSEAKRASNNPAACGRYRCAGRYSAQSRTRWNAARTYQGEAVLGQTNAARVHPIRTASIRAVGTHAGRQSADSRRAAATASGRLAMNTNRVGERMRAGSATVRVRGH